MGSFFSSAYEDEYSDEKMIKGSDFYQYGTFWSFESQFKPSLCKIILPNGNMGTGFFISLTLKSNRIIHGLLTNNHVLNQNDILPGKSFKILVDANNQFRTVTLSYKMFTFTDSNLDATFIEIKPEELPKEVVFLKPIYYWNDNIENAFIIQHPNGGDFRYARGKIVYKYEHDIVHQISTLPGSSGSPIINKDGYVIGIHKSGSNRTEHNYGTDIISIKNCAEKWDQARHFQYNFQFKI